jgi:hypothetical protein
MTAATAENTEPQSMDQRIADVLKAPDGVPSVTFDLMLRWVRAKIVLTRQDAQKALKDSLDPAIIDPGALGRAHDAEHAIKRLENSEAALTPLHQAATRREDVENWKTSTADLKQRVTDLSQELLATYADVTGKLVDLFSRCDAADKAVALVNHGAPGVLHCLHGVEATLTNGSATKIIPKIKLPALALDGRDAPDIWPPRVIPIGIELSAHVAAMMGGARPMTEDERIAESMRVTKFYEDQERGRIRLGDEAEARAREQRRAAAGG